MNKNIEYFAIVALDLNQGIGYKDQILFHNKMDLNIFKQYSTYIQNCIVGRVTYNTLPKVLGKTRKFHIITRTEQIFDNDSVCITDKVNLDQNKYVIVGGNEIYKMFSQDVKVWVITTHKKHANLIDTYFDNKMYEKIISSNQSIELYEDEDILVKIYF